MRYSPKRVIDGVARRIAELRAEKGWTQAELAAALDMTYQRISQLEGGRNLTLETLAHLANALDVEIAAFFAMTPKRREHRLRGRPKKRR